MASSWLLQDINYFYHLKKIKKEEKISSIYHQPLIIVCHTTANTQSSHIIIDILHLLTFHPK